MKLDELKEKKQEEENQNGIDGDYDLNESVMNEQLIDTDSNKQSSEKIIQKILFKHLMTLTGGGWEKQFQSASTASTLIICIVI